METATVDGFLDRLGEIEERFRSPEFSRQQWEDVIRWMEASHANYFASETSPDGEPWAELSEWTIKKKGHSKKLVELYHLLQSMTDSNAEYAIRTIEPAELEFGTSRPFAASHQFGTDRIPQREFAGVSQVGADAVGELAADAALQMFLQVFDNP